LLRTTDKTHSTQGSQSQLTYWMDTPPQRPTSGQGMELETVPLREEKNIILLLDPLPTHIHTQTHTHTLF
jgi:hypothetical protein